MLSLRPAQKKMTARSVYGDELICIDENIFVKPYISASTEIVPDEVLADGSETFKVLVCFIMYETRYHASLKKQSLFGQTLLLNALELTFVRKNEELNFNSAKYKDGLMVEISRMCPAKTPDIAIEINLTDLKAVSADELNGFCCCKELVQSCSSFIEELLKSINQDIDFYKQRVGRRRTRYPSPL